jgi:hypothetical protein
MKRFLSVLLLSLFAAATMAGTDVYTPTLKTPVNNTLNQMPNLTLSWNAIVGSITLTYEIQIDTSQNFNSPVRSDTSLVLLTGYTAHELFFGKKYYWRVRAIDNGETSAWSAPWTFTVFGHVTPVFPVLNPTAKTKDTIAPKQVLSWSTKDSVIVGSTFVLTTITGVRYYDIQCDTTKNFNSPQLRTGTVAYPINYFWTNNLRFGTKYYWRVRARHNLSTSNWSTIFYFTVASTIVPTTPALNAIDQVLNATLIWKNVKGMLAYQYQLALDSNFTDVIASSEVDTNFVNSQYTKFGLKYYWRVRGRHISDTTVWSAKYSFTTIDMVKLKSPANNSSSIALKPTLVWTKQTGIVQFQLQIDVTSDFSSNPLFIDVKLADTLTSIALTKNMKNSTTYYWRMRAFSDSQVPDISNWSPVWNFKTLSTGIGENGVLTSSIYPNPASDMLNIKLNVEEPLNLQVTVIDLLGSTLISEAFDLNSGINYREINLNTLNKGLYIVRLKYNGNEVNHKLIIDK